MAALILTSQSTFSAAPELYSLKTLTRSTRNVPTCFSDRVSRFHRRSRLCDANLCKGGEKSDEKIGSLVLLLPLIGSSSISTSLLGITGVLAPVLEENVFRGFLMVSLTKWLPTPLAIFVSAAVFAVAHLSPGEFPSSLFLLQGYDIKELLQAAS